MRVRKAIRDAHKGKEISAWTAASASSSQGGGFAGPYLSVEAAPSTTCNGEQKTPSIPSIKNGG